VRYIDQFFKSYTTLDKVCVVEGVKMAMSQVISKKRISQYHGYSRLVKLMAQIQPAIAPEIDGEWRDGYYARAYESVSRSESQF
jgi:hypothetical protein